MKNSSFSGICVKRRQIILPDDFAALTQYVDPFVSEPAMINLDIQDVLQCCALDPETKTCRDGQLQAIEFSCAMDALAECGGMIGDLSGCRACVIMATLDGAFGLMEMERIIDMLRAQCGDEPEMLAGIRLADSDQAEINVRIVCRLGK